MLFIYVQDIDIEIISVKDSQIGDIPVETLDDTIYFFEQTIISIIDGYLPPGGLNLEKLLNVTNLGIEKSEINLHANYIELLLTPKFTADKKKLFDHLSVAMKNLG